MHSILRTVALYCRHGILYCGDVNGFATGTAFPLVADPGFGGHREPRD